MASSVLTNLALAFLVAGFTLFATALVLSRRAHRYQHGMQTLLQLASSPIELLDLPAAAWPVLHGAGWCHLRWEGDWYGQPVQGSLGEDTLARGTNDELRQLFEVSSGAQARLSVALRHSAPRGEKRLFATHLAQVFVLLLETRLRERTGALSAALAERARLSLYLQHDMRNLAQWVSWVSTDFVHADSEPRLMAAARRLQTNAPLALERAQRLTNALGKERQAGAPRDVVLRDAIEQAARLAGLELAIDGDATAWIAPELLERALDNLLGNLAADWREGLTAAPQVSISRPIDPDGDCAGTVQILLVCPLPPEGMELPPEKLFEPFASGRPGGLGLGLYQARTCLREAGGDLHATVVRRQLQFALRIPQKCEKVGKNDEIEPRV
ncbi:MAG: hypothetical protein CFE43_06035 [Burkholderiales bacterium PBB3]|nr:MAG: hypothetical protein CFE43_06035 [Burkholderiales bacterium PBB3]